MTPLVELIAAILDLLAAVLFMGSGIGLVRLPDFYTRCHSPTKVVSLGFLLFTAAAALRHADSEHAGVLVRLALLLGLVFVTVPISAQMLMRAGIANDVPRHPGTRGEPSIEPLIEPDGQARR